MRPAPPSEATVPSLRAQFLVREFDAARVVDLPALDLCRLAGIDVDVLSDPVARVPLRLLARVYDLAAERSGDDALGLHVGERAGPGVTDLVDYAFISRPTLARAFEDLHALVAPLYPEAEISLLVDDRVATFGYRIDASEAPHHRHRCEALMTSVLKLAERALGTRKPLVRVAFQHPRPADTAEHQRIFAAPVHFDWPANELVFDAHWLRVPLATADANLSAVLDRHLHDLASRIPASQSKPFSHDVRRRLAQVFRSGTIALPALAKSLGVSERTFQRRLREEGTSLQELVDTVRAELSLSLLGDSDLSLAEVADRLGYASLGAFSRAFRRWRGLSPAAHRKATRGRASA
jgi:AraC-like DNA-binding protein